MLLILPLPAVPGPGWETPPHLGPPEEIQAVTGLPGRVLASLDALFPPVRQAKQALLRREGVSRLSVQLLSHVRLSATPWTAACQASLSITNSWNSPKPMSIESVMPSNRLILCRPLLLLPSIFPSLRVFSDESVLCIRWPKYWSFSFSISPSSEHPGLISFRMDWLDLFAVQGTLKSLLQHHSSKASILQLPLWSPSYTPPHSSTHSRVLTVTCWHLHSPRVRGWPGKHGPALSRGRRTIYGSQLPAASPPLCSVSLACCLTPSLAFQSLFNLF